MRINKNAINLPILLKIVLIKKKKTNLVEINIPFMIL